MPLATTGTPLAIASMSTTGIPSLALCSWDAGRDEDVRATEELRDLGPWTAAVDCHASLEPFGGDLAHERLPVGTVADERAGDVNSSLGEQAACLDEVGLALDLVQRSHAENGEGPLGPRALAWAEEVRVDPAMDDSEPCARRSPHSSRISLRLYSETATTKAASATFSRSMWRSTWRSKPCAVKLYGMPVKRLTTKPAAAGWFEKWQ